MKGDGGTPLAIGLAYSWLILAAGCAPVAVGEAPAAPGGDPHPAWQRAAGSVASLTVTVPGLRGYRHGSGFFVRPTLLVTDFHVIAEADRLLTITLANGSVLPWSRIRLISRPYDLALIETPPVAVASLPVARGVRQRGRVAALAGRWVRTACGVQAVETTIAGFGIHRPPGRLETVDVLLLPPGTVCQGFSGGPVVDEGGQVVGVVRGLLRARPRLEAGSLPQVEVVAAATGIRHLHDALAELDAARTR